jgi:hypothetical protein
MEHVPFRIKVDAVITRADGVQENLGTISSNTTENKNDHSTDEQDQKQFS